jgi:hypothetical protein
MTDALLLLLLFTFALFYGLFVIDRVERFYDDMMEFPFPLVIFDCM